MSDITNGHHRIELKLDAEKITLDDLVMVDDLRSGELPARQLRDFVSRFLIGEDGEYLPEQEALRLAGKLNMMQLRETFDALGVKMKELQATAVPPDRSGS